MESIGTRLGRQLNQWDYDFSRFEITSFIAWVAARRGRPIQTVPMTLPPELFGAWIEGDAADYIFYEDEPLHVHTVHIILHELCHILLGHKTSHISGQTDRLLQFHGNTEERGDQPLFRGLLRQISRSDEQELEAEMLSNLIQHRVYQQAGIAALSQPGRGLAMQQFMQGLGMDESV